MVVVPYRITSAPAPAPLDEADSYEAELRAASSRLRLVVLTTFAAVAATSVVTLVEAHSRLEARHLADVERQVLTQNAREVVAAATSFAELERARFEAAMADALAPPAGAPSPARCTFADPSSTDAPLALFTAGDAEISSPSLTRVLDDAKLADAHLRAGRFSEGIATANALALRIASPNAWPRYDVVLVTTKLKPPSALGPTSFSPGAVSGRAYVYDFSKHRVVCAGDVEATNSDRVEYTFTPSLGPRGSSSEPRLLSKLAEDLAHRIRSEVASVGLNAFEPLRAHKVERREPGADTEPR